MPDHVHMMRHAVMRAARLKFLAGVFILVALAAT
jgi:hypothetical protein